MATLSTTTSILCPAGVCTALATLASPATSTSAISTCPLSRYSSTNAPLTSVMR